MGKLARRLICSTVNIAIGVAVIQLIQKKLASASPASGPRKIVWIINQDAVTPDMPGNARQFEHAQFLDLRGWSTTVFASPFNHKRGTYLRPVSIVRPFLRLAEGRARAVWVYTLPYRGNDWRRYANMVSFLVGSVAAGVRQRPKPDAIIGSSPQLLSGLAAWLLAKWHRVPFVFEVRDLWPETLVGMGLTSKAVIGPLEWIESFLYRQADAIVILADRFHGHVVANGGRSDRLTLIPNAPMRTGKPESVIRQATRARFGWDEEVVFIYAGAHGPANGLDTVVAAAAMLPPNSRAHVVLIGDGPERERLIQLAGGNTHLQFLPPVSRAEVANILAGADAGIVTLRKAKVFEGVRPNKIYDYLALAMPVVSNVPGEARDILEVAGAGAFAAPGDSQSLAITIDHLASHPDELNRLRISAVTYANTMPTREDAANQLACLLDSVITRSRSKQ